MERSGGSTLMATTTRQTISSSGTAVTGRRMAAGATRWLFALAAAGALVAVLTGLAAAIAQAGPAPLLRIGTEPWLGYGPWWIAEEKGLFEKRGLRVQLVNFIQDQDLNAALAAGRLEGANIATHTAIKFLESGIDMKLVLLLDASYEADAIMAGPGVGSVRDLRGKTVAYEEGTTSDLLLSYALRRHGMSKADIRSVPMPAADAGAAAIAGRVDVAVTYEPYLTTALSRNKAFRLIYTAAERPGLISDFLVFRPEVLQRYPDEVRRMVLVWQDALDYLAERPDEAKAIIARKVGSSVEELELGLAGVRLYSLSENAELFRGEIRTILEDVNRVMIEAGMARRTWDAARILDGSFLP